MATDKENGYSIYNSVAQVSSYFNANDFQATKNSKFTGLCIKTSATMPTLSFGSALTNKCAHPATVITNQNAAILGSSFYGVPSGAEYYDGNGKTGGFKYFYVGKSGNYKFIFRGGPNPDGWTTIWINHQVKYCYDGNGECISTLSLLAGDLITMKLSRYQSEYHYDENPIDVFDVSDENYLSVESDMPFCWCCGETVSSPIRYNYSSDDVNYEYKTEYSPPNITLPPDYYYNYKGNSYSGNTAGLYTFTALTSGTLSVTLTNGANKDKAVAIWINTSKKPTYYINTDNNTGTHTYNINSGDVVIIAYGLHSDLMNATGIKNPSQWVDEDGSFSYSFTGSVGCSTVSHQLTWNEYARMCLWEARHKCSSYSDYAVPLCFYDDAVNADRMKVLFDTLSDVGMFVDLTVNSGNTITGSNDTWKSYCKYLTIETRKSLNNYFNGNSIVKTAAISTESTATQAFYNASALTSLTVYNVTSDASQIAASCPALTSITLSGDFNSVNFKNAATRTDDTIYKEVSISGNIYSCDFTNFVQKASTIAINVKGSNTFFNFATDVNGSISIKCTDENIFTKFLNGGQVSVSSTSIALCNGNNFVNFNSANSFTSPSISTVYNDASSPSSASRNNNFTEAFMNANCDTVTLTNCNGYDTATRMFKNSTVKTATTNWTGSELIDASEMFAECHSLTTVIADGVHGCCDKMFYNDYNLTSDPIIFNDASSCDYTYYNCYKVPKSKSQLQASLNKFLDNWTTGVNRTTFFNCPYNGTILEKYLSYDKQKELGFDPAALCYYAIKDRPNSLDPGYENINHSDSTWSEYVTDYVTYETPHTLVAVSHQLDESGAAAYLQLDDNIIFTYSRRGTCVGVFDCKTNTVKEWDWTDTHNYELKTTSLETVWQKALAVATSTDIVFVLSYDATSRDSAARQHCLDIGGSTANGTWSAARYAEAQLGKVGLGQNNGYESIRNGTNSASVTCKYTTDGMICSTWMDVSKNYIYKPGEIAMNEHPSQYYALQVPCEQWWRWKYLIKNIASLSDSCAFEHCGWTDLSLSVLLDGSDAKSNSNSAISLGNITENLSSANMRYHLARIENVTESSIAINGIMKDSTHLHCVDGSFVNIDDISHAFEKTSLTSVHAKLEGCTKADYAFANSSGLVDCDCSSSAIVSGQFMFYNCPNMKTVDITGMTALKDATSMFEKDTSLTKAVLLPDSIEIAKRMFAECSITEIEGNWVLPNSSAFQNTLHPKENATGIKELETTVSKEGWSFPSHLTSAYQMFYGNPLTKVTHLHLNKNADNSWLFQDCSSLATFKLSWIDVNTTSDDYYTGIFDGCCLTADNENWLPISIDSSFALDKTGISNGNNKAPTCLWVDDYWCEVDNSGFLEYQHLRRPPYLAVYDKNNSTKYLIKFWSHIHLHDATHRGFNELHDAFVYHSEEETHSPTVWISSTK